MRQERNAVLFWTKKMRESVKAGIGGIGWWRGRNGKQVWRIKKGIGESRIWIIWKTLYTLVVWNRDMKGKRK